MSPSRAAGGEDASRSGESRAEGGVPQVWPAPLDAMRAAADHHRVLFENERVRVLEAWVAPGETVPVHTHRWPGVVEVLCGSHVVRRDAGGRVLLDTRRSGEPLRTGSVFWGESLPPHSLENVGTAELRTRTVELKDWPGPRSADPA